MGFNWQETLDVDNGFGVDTIIISGGNGSPVGNDAPIGSWYFQDTGDVWKKTQSGASGWVKNSNAIPFDPTGLLAYQTSDIDVYKALKRLSDNSPSPNGGGAITFSSQGAVNSGEYLFVGKVPTSDAGMPVIGLNKLVSITSTSKQLITGSPAKLQIFNRTAVNTRVDIAGAIISIPVGQYRGTVQLDIDLASDPELGVRVMDDSSQMKSALVTLQLKFLGY